MLKYKNLSRRDLLSMVGGSASVAALWGFVPRVEAAEAEANEKINRYSYWFEYTHPKKGMVYENFPTNTGPLKFRNGYSAFNDDTIRNDIILMRRMSRPSSDGGDGPHPSGAAGITGWRGGGNGKYQAATTTLDQVLSQKFAKDSLIADLRAGFRNAGKDGAYDISASVVKGQPQTRYQSPVDMYNDYFANLAGPGMGGGGSKPSDTLRRRASVLDYVTGAMNKLERKISHFDREKVQAHLDSLRKVETEVENLMNLGSTGANGMDTCEGLDAPKPYDGADADVIYPIYSQLMTRALACNMTRVAGAHYGSSANRIAYSHLESYKGGGFYHNATHGKHSGPDYLRDVLKFRADKVAEYIKMLKEVVEPDGSSLLDNTVFFWTSELIGDHDNNGDPLTLVAGGRERFKGHGNMINVPAKHNDLLVSIAQYMGHNIDKFGDNRFVNGPLPNSVFS